MTNRQPGPVKAENIQCDLKDLTADPQKHAEERWSLYLEVCVIDAFKDERWSSGLYSHHRETERGRGIRESKSVQQKKNHKQQWKLSRMWLITDSFIWLITDLTTPLCDLSLLEVNWTQTGHTGKPCASRLIHRPAVIAACFQANCPKTIKYNDHFLSPVVYRNPKQKDPAWFPPWVSALPWPKNILPSLFVDVFQLWKTLKGGIQSGLEQLQNSLIFCR